MEAKLDQTCRVMKRRGVLLHLFWDLKKCWPVLILDAESWNDPFGSVLSLALDKTPPVLEFLNEIQRFADLDPKFIVPFGLEGMNDHHLAALSFQCN